MWRQSRDPQSRQAKMRERNLLYLFLGLNVALAGAFMVYLFLSTHRQPEVVATSFVPAAKTNITRAVQPANLPKTNVIAAATNKSATPVATARSGGETAVAAPPKPTFTGRKFTWQDVETDPYRTYIESLRAVGCPDDKIRTIVLADINELFDKKRVKEAVQHDMQWWRPEGVNEM